MTKRETNVMISPGWLLSWDRPNFQMKAAHQMWVWPFQWRAAHLERWG